MKWRGDKLRAYRKAANMTQALLGEEIGATQQLIAKYECGKIEPTIKKINLLASALGINAAKLLDIEDEKDLLKAFLDEAFK